MSSYICYSYDIVLRDSYTCQLWYLQLLQCLVIVIYDEMYVTCIGISYSCMVLSQFRGIRATSIFIYLMPREVPWNSMELLVSSKLEQSKFHGIAWNCSCQRNWRTTNSMEVHGTARVCEIGALQFPWNSMELLVSSKLAHPNFHEIPCNSIELLVSSKLAHHKFHGIPWNCSCHRNWRTPIFM